MTPGFWKGAGPPAEEPNQARDQRPQGGSDTAGEQACPPARP